MSGTGRPLASAAGAVLCSSAGAVLFDGVFSTSVTATHLSSSVSGSYNSYFNSWMFFAYANGSATVSMTSTFRITNNGTVSANITGFVNYWISTHAAISFSWTGGLIAAGAYQDVTVTLTVYAGAGMGESAACGTWYHNPDFAVAFTGGTCPVLYSGTNVCYEVQYPIVCD